MLALKEDGTVWAWGYNNYRQLGDNTTTIRSLPIHVLGEDGEASVDGIHFTDLGMMRYADLVCPVIKKVLKK